MRRNWLRSAWTAQGRDEHEPCAMPGCKEPARYFGREGWCARHTEPKETRLVTASKEEA